jgi:hypothetical protein
MEIDPGNPVVKLCVEGMAAESENRFDDARALYQRAWDERSDDYEGCIAAHYLARVQVDRSEGFRWNREALDRAYAVGDERVTGFLPSLYLNLGRSFEEIGNLAAARWCYEEARAGLGGLPEGDYADVVARGIAGGEHRTDPDAGPDGTPDA